jgi:hypothetical protein
MGTCGNKGLGENRRCGVASRTYTTIRQGDVEAVFGSVVVEQHRPRHFLFRFVEKDQKVVVLLLRFRLSWPFVGHHVLEDRDRHSLEAGNRNIGLVSKHFSVCSP